MEKAKQILNYIIAVWVLALLTWGAVMVSSYLASIKHQAETKAKIDILKIKSAEMAKVKKKSPKELADYLNKLIGVK
jgi:hypothetical protein